MASLEQKIRDFVLSHQIQANLLELNEAQVRNKIIDPILSLLGWETHAIEVEEATGIFYHTKHADYVLRGPRTQTVFAVLEAKRPSVPLYRPRDCPQSAKWDMEEWLCQSLNYSLLLGAEFTILANGLSWLVLETFEPGLSVFDRDILWFPSLSEIADRVDEFALISAAAVESGDFQNFAKFKKNACPEGHFCYLNKEGIDQLCHDFNLQFDSSSAYYAKVMALLSHLRGTNCVAFSLEPYEKQFTYVAGDFKLIDDDEQYLSFQSTEPKRITMNMRKTKGTLWPYPTKMSRLSHINLAMRGGIHFRVFGEWYSDSYLRPHAVSIVGYNLGSSMNKLA
jgi:hypothetical protein